MGGALLQRVATLGRAYVVDPAPAPAQLKSLATWLPAPDKLEKDFKPDIVILTVKPQHMAEALPAYARFKSSVFLSIAAGQSIKRLGELLGGDNFAIARAMPNLPASVGAGATVASANKNVTAAQRALCDKILGAVGSVHWVEDENLLDAVTALSGSGPAYFFALAEAMTKAGVALGLPKELATQLARQTLIGSGALLAQSPETLEALRAAVTSPGGTTEAALKHLGRLDELLLKAIKAAAARAKELSA